MSNNQKGISSLLAIIIVIALGIAVIGGVLAYQSWWTPKEELPEEAPKDETIDWQTYKNEHYGYELKYPPDWKFSDEGGIIVDFCGPEHWQQAGDCRMAGKGSTAAITLRNDSLDIKKTEFCQENPLNIFCGKILSQKEATIGGKDGEIFEMDVNNGYLVALWKRAPTDKRMYQLSADELNDLPQRRDVFNQMLSTFRFIEKEVETPAAPASETADWKTYRNEEYGFEIKYPLNFKETTDVNPAGTFSLYLGYSNTQYVGDILIRVHKNYNNDTIVQYFTKKKVEAMAFYESGCQTCAASDIDAEFYDCMANKANRTEIAGKEAFLCSQMPERMNIPSPIYVFYKGYIYEFRGLSLKKEYVQILSTFRFIPLEKPIP